MNMTYILHNPEAGTGDHDGTIEALQGRYENCSVINICRISSYETFFLGLDEQDRVIVCGGDGTLNRFINDTAGIAFKNSICYCPCGSGNDFSRDLGYQQTEHPVICIDQYLAHLPQVTVDGRSWRFINNVGFGIDGYCTEEGEKQRQKNKQITNPKPINYTAIAIKGLLFHFKPRNATVTVDGEEHSYKKVWLIPTMNGRYYGGGMMPTPDQDRNDEAHRVSVMVYQAPNKLKALMMFPSIFEGKHVKHKKHITILQGHDVSVTFDQPTPLQIDGETVPNVTAYTVSAG